MEMDMRAAIIENGKVVNIASASQEFAELQGWVITEEAQIGWTYSDGKFSPPPPPPPPSKEEQQTARANAYREEADPLFFKYQRGEGSEQEWLNKIEEIRGRFPYPTEE